MSNITSLKYVNTHEWVKEEGQQLTVGITDHAQNLLGDVVFAELPEVEDRYAATEKCMLLESVKAASDIYMPVSGKVLAINTRLKKEPELINQDAFGDGWLFRIQPDNLSDVDNLLSFTDYEALTDE